jgi:hypothetical protein
MNIIEIQDLVLREFAFLVDDMSFQKPVVDETMGPYLHNDIIYTKGNLQVFLELEFMGLFSIAITFDTIDEPVRSWLRKGFRQFLSQKQIPVPCEWKDYDKERGKIPRRKIKRDEIVLTEVLTKAKQLKDFFGLIPFNQIVDMLTK